MLWRWQQWLTSVLPQVPRASPGDSGCVPTITRTHDKMNSSARGGKGCHGKGKTDRHICVCTVSLFPFNRLFLINNSSPSSNFQLQQKVGVLTMSHWWWKLFSCLQRCLERSVLCRVSAWHPNLPGLGAALFQWDTSRHCPSKMPLNTQGSKLVITNELEQSVKASSLNCFKSFEVTEQLCMQGVLYVSSQQEQGHFLLTFCQECNPILCFSYRLIWEKYNRSQHLLTSQQQA